MERNAVYLLIPCSVAGSGNTKFREVTHHTSVTQLVGGRGSWPGLGLAQSSPLDHVPGKIHPLTSQQ